MQWLWKWKNNREKSGKILIRRKTIDLSILLLLDRYMIAPKDKTCVHPWFALLFIHEIDYFLSSYSADNVAQQCIDHDLDKL